MRHYAPMCSYSQSTDLTVSIHKEATCEVISDTRQVPSFAAVLSTVNLTNNYAIYFIYNFY